MISLMHERAHSCLKNKNLTRTVPVVTLAHSQSKHHGHTFDGILGTFSVAIFNSKTVMSVVTQ